MKKHFFCIWKYSTQKSVYNVCGTSVLYYFSYNNAGKFKKCFFNNIGLCEEAPLFSIQSVSKKTQSCLNYQKMCSLMSHVTNLKSVSAQKNQNSDSFN